MLLQLAPERHSILLLKRLEMFETSSEPCREPLQVVAECRRRVGVGSENLCLAS
jgi:hypothetical protein